MTYERYPDRLRGPMSRGRAYTPSLLSIERIGPPVCGQI